MIDASLDINQLQNLRDNFPNYATDPSNNGLPLNPLKGTFALVNGPQGFNAVGLPVHLANFSTGASIINGASLVTLQLSAADTGVFEDSYNEPSLYASDTAGEYLGGAGGVNAALNANPPSVTGALEASNILNEWSRRTNAAAGWVTATDWVITFPTKSLHVDNDPNNEFAGRNNGRLNAIPAPGLTAVELAPFTQSFVDTAATPAVRRGQSCDTVSYILRNREEQRSSAAGFSPGGSSQICYESQCADLQPGSDPGFAYRATASTTRKTIPSVG